MNLCRSTKPIMVKKHKNNLGKIIIERPNNINSREEFSHWTITLLLVKNPTMNVLF
ncbi:hypothetical protein [Clostridium botulinum]|uniref:hypothetical protein n=1 Tax=Clostridium botulinum TaxID=1491 RepID=UPI0003261259|nr:hypothetical protein [Clostridium botulinum]